MREFMIRKAEVRHVSEIMSVIEEAHQSMEEQDWFAADDESFIREIFTGKGFVIGAWDAETGELAGYFSVVFPDGAEHLGRYAGLSEEEFGKVVYLDSTAVKEAYRGNGLQGKMLRAAEAELDKRLKDMGESVQYRICTVHPKNRYSLGNMQKHGYEVLGWAKLYGGLERYVLCKQVQA